MRKLASLLLLLTLLTACGPTEAEIGARAEELAQTLVAENYAATPTEIILPTATSQPTQAPSASSDDDAPAPSATPESATATLPPAGSDDEPIIALPTDTADFGSQNTARLRLQNDSSDNVFLTLSGPYSQYYAFSDSFNVDVPWGAYSYSVYIGDDGPYTGSFSITNADKYTLVFEDGNVKELGP